MRDYSRGIIAHRTEIAGDDVTHIAPCLDSMVSWLDKAARNPTACVALDNLRLPPGKLKGYKSDVLIQVVMLCHYLRSAGQLDRVAKVALKTGLSADAFHAALENLEKLPHGSTVSKHMFHMDLAYCKYWRKHRWPQLLRALCNGTAMVNLSGDSSPQFGRDWFILEIHVVETH